MAAGVTEPAATTRRNVVPGAYRGVAVTSVDVRARRGVPDAALHRSGGLSADPVHRRPQRRGRRRSSRCRRRPRSRCSHRSPALQLLVGAGRLRVPRGPRGRHRDPDRAGARGARAAPAASAAWWCRAGTGTSASSSTRRPLRVTVREVVPPYPPKLLDQVRRVLDAGRAPAADRAGPRRRRARRPGAVPAVEQLPPAVPGRWRRRSRARPPTTWTNTPSAGTGR